MFTVQSEVGENGGIGHNVGENAFVTQGEEGFKSGESLFMARGSCKLSTLTHHQVLREADVECCDANFESHDTQRPRRYEPISVNVGIKASGPGADPERLTRIAHGCTLGRALEATVRIDIQVEVVDS